MQITASAKVAAEIRAAMARKNLRRADLAKHLGLSQSAVSLRLSGQQAMTVNEIVDIAEWANVDAAALIGAALAEQGSAA